QRRSHDQSTAALRHLSRLARGDPDDLFRQDHVLERGPVGTPRLESEPAAGLTADTASTSAGIAAFSTPLIPPFARPHTRTIEGKCFRPKQPDGSIASVRLEP